MRKIQKNHISALEILLPHGQSRHKRVLIHNQFDNE